MRRLVWVAMMMAVAACAMGQNNSMRDEAMDSALTSHKFIYFGKGEEPPRDSVTSLIRQFYENQFHHFSDPLAPYFLFLSKDSKQLHTETDGDTDYGVIFDSRATS